MAQTILETPGLWRRSSSWLTKRTVEVNGLNFYEKAMKNENGTIFLVPHMGNWEVVGLWLAHETKITSLYEPPKLEALEKWIFLKNTSVESIKETLFLLNHARSY